MTEKSSEAPFTFGFFVAALGYHREVRKGKGIYVKRLDRKRYSLVTPEAMRLDYEDVCKCFSSQKKEG